MNLNQLKRKIVIAVFYGSLCLVRLVKNIRLVSFDSTRLAHMLSMTGYYLRKRQLDSNNVLGNDILVCAESVCNEVYLNMINEQVTVIKSDFLKKLIDATVKYKPDTPAIKELKGILYDPEVYEITTSPFIIKEEQKSKGINLLKEMGVPLDAPVICFAVRDKAYLNKSSPENGWNYHDFRNGSLDSYIKMAEELTKEGFWMIRMGSVVESGINSTNPMIIDYASNYRTDFGDVFLGNWCYLFVSDTSGITHLAQSQGNGGVRGNLGMGDVFSPWPNFLSLPLLYRDRSTKKILTFKDTIKENVHNMYRSEEFEKAGLEIIYNTAEELKNAVIERHLKINGDWEPEISDIELQDEFFNIYPDDFCVSVANFKKIPRKSHSPISTSFLRKHSGLFT
jgi:putative glycosyltransferase (TIGR04372 family)